MTRAAVLPLVYFSGLGWLPLEWARSKYGKIKIPNAGHQSEWKSFLRLASKWTKPAQTSLIPDTNLNNCRLIFSGSSLTGPMHVSKAGP